MTIDVTTGLPVLPEGQHWRVKTAYDRFTDKEYVKVQAIEVSYRQVRQHWDLWIFRIPRGWVELKSVDIVCEWPVWDPNGMPKGKDRETLIPAPNGQKYPPLAPYLLKPEHVLAAAEFALEQKKISDKAESLLGDYPPNKLPE